MKRPHVNDKKYQYPNGEFKSKLFEADKSTYIDYLEAKTMGPEPFTPGFLSYLLVSALRYLNKEQMHNLALSLAVRDSMFSVDQYIKTIIEEEIT